MKWWKIFFGSFLISISCLAKQYQTYEENGKIGMKDDVGNVVLPPKFEALGWSDGSFSVVSEIMGYRLQGLWGIINLKKEFVTKPEYERLEYASGECIVAQKKINAAFHKTGCLNLRGEIKIPFIYDDIEMQGLRGVVINLTRSGFKYGLVNWNNILLMPVVYKNIYPVGTLRYAVENADGKIALFSEDGKAITDFSIDSISNFYKGYAIVYQEHLQGLIDRHGETKLEVKYSSIQISNEGKVFARLPNEWFFINDRNETVRQIFADQLQYVQNDCYLIKKGNAWGLINKELKPAIPIVYDRLKNIDIGKYLATYKSKTGVIKEDNKQIIPFQFDELNYDGKLFRAFSKQKGWELLDAEGKVLIDKFYERMIPTEANYVVTIKGFYGVINSLGKEIIHCVFDSLSMPVNDKVAVKFRGNYGIINTNEDWIVAPQQFPLTVINAKCYLQKQIENQFIKSFSGEIKYFTPYPLKFDSTFFIETLPNGIEKRISYDGIILQRTEVPERTQEIFKESEGLLGIKKDGRYGFVDVKGKLRIANRYDSIGEFHEGLAPAKLIGKWGFVNTSDKIVINPNYDALSNFLSGIAIVSRGRKFGLIKKDGSVILPLRYDDVKRMPASFLVKSANYFGLADDLGNITIEPRFDSLTKVDDQLLIACRDANCGVISNTGLNVIPMIYGQLVFTPREKIFIGEKKSSVKEIQFTESY